MGPGSAYVSQTRGPFLVKLLVDDKDGLQATTTVSTVAAVAPEKLFVCFILLCNYLFVLYN